jgi:predicted nucleic acid-binding Zn finger protein
VVDDDDDDGDCDEVVDEEGRSTSRKEEKKRRGFRVYVCRRSEDLLVLGWCAVAQGHDSGVRSTKSKGRSQHL